MKIYQNINELVGNTPLVRLNKISENHQLAGNLFAKIEYFNPAGSVKDRIAKNMIETAEEMGVLKPGMKIVEATSGNTGIGLAAMGVSKGYEVILVMPETMSVERRKMMMAYGAKFVLTPGAEGMKGAVAKALEMKATDETVFIPSQFENEANVLAHYKTTGPELVRDLDGQVDVFVAGVGTGGTITGTLRYLHEQGIQTYGVAVEPESSAVLSGEPAGKHAIQGIGAGFIPSILETQRYSEIIKVSNQDAIKLAREISQTEGFFVGISSGAALKAAIEVASREEFRDKNIVVLLPDSGDRYLSTALFEE